MLKYNCKTHIIVSFPHPLDDVLGGTNNGLFLPGANCLQGQVVKHITVTSAEQINAAAAAAAATGVTVMPLISGGN